ncbi:MAG: hypothetical protein ACOX60_02875 [Massiliimalia sp.]|jgi:DNA repair exonuclease SbcCD ATPase subunit
MKRITAMLLAAVLMISMAACENTSSADVSSSDISDQTSVSSQVSNDSDEETQAKQKEEKAKKKEYAEAAQKIMDRIDNLGTITLDSKATVSDLQKEYDNAAPEVQKLVTNYTVLTEAGQTISKLEEEKAAAEKAAAEKAAAEKAAAEKAAAEKAAAEKVAAEKAAAEKAAAEQAAAEKAAAEKAAAEKAAAEQAAAQQAAQAQNPSGGGQQSAQEQPQGQMVWVTPTGKRYHYDSTCNGGHYYQATLEEALSRGLTPCKKCIG